MKALSSITGIAILLAGVGCSSIQTEPWFDGDLRIGTITKTETEEGFTYRYEDEEELLRVLEYRGSEGELVDGMSTLRYDYDQEGRQITECAFDRDGIPAETEELWSEHRTDYSRIPSGAEVIEHLYRSPVGGLVTIQAGYAVKRIEYENASERLHRIDFYGPDRDPTGVEYRGTSGVSSVTFAYLKGLKPICMAALRDDSQTIIGRIKISGTSYAVRSSQSYGAYYYRPLPVRSRAK